MVTFVTGTSNTRHMWQALLARVNFEMDNFYFIFIYFFFGGVYLSCPTLYISIIPPLLFYWRMLQMEFDIKTDKKLLVLKLEDAESQESSSFSSSQY